MEGGSTITQQVAKNMLLTKDQNLDRKAKEAIVAQRMEKEFTKAQILELYLNEIYLGGQSYGVASAALNYFDKSLSELDLSEAAVLASLPKFPGRVNPYTIPGRVLARRNYVLDRMLEDGYITKEERDEARARPLTTVKRLRGPEYIATTYFVQELRRDLEKTYGEDTLKQGGLSIRSTIDTRLQLAAQQALQNGLIAYDRRHGWRGPVTTLPVDENAAAELGRVKLPGGYGTWEPALVTNLTASSADLLLKDGATIKLPAEEIKWAQTFKPEGGKAGLQVGQVILAEFRRERETAGRAIRPGRGRRRRKRSRQSRSWCRRQRHPAPGSDVEGSIVAIDPHTYASPRCRAATFFKSQLNRVTQSRRQPGSSFRPVYAPPRWKKATRRLRASWTRHSFRMTSRPRNTGHRKTTPPASPTETSPCVSPLRNR